jgi:hypothetical protein
MKHTPGPWAINRDKQGNLNITSNTRPYVAQVFDNDIFDEEQDANAKLIAAAPDLLAALIEIKQGGFGKHAYAIANAAINKATGEQL